MKDQRVRAAVLVLLLWMPRGASLWWPEPSFIYETHCDDETGWRWWFDGCPFLS